MKNLFLVIVFVIVLTASALFFAQNDKLIEVHFFGLIVSWQMNWVLITFMVIGFSFGIVAVIGSLLTAKVKLANANRRLAMHQKEINNLRALPIKDEY